MVLGLFALMVLTFLLAEFFFFSKKLSATSSAPAPHLSAGGPEPIERFFHTGHTWAVVQSSNAVVVGVSDFSQRFIGRLDGIELPKEGTQLRQGEAMVILKRRERCLPQVAPISWMNSSLIANLPHTTTNLEKGSLP